MLEKAAVGKIHEKGAIRGVNRFSEMAEKEKKDRKKFMRDIYKNVDKELEDDFTKETHTFANQITVVDTRKKGQRAKVICNAKDEED